MLVVVGAAEGGGGQGASGHVELVVQTLVVRGLGARHYEGDQVEPGEDSEDTVEDVGTALTTATVPGVGV